MKIEIALSEYLKSVFDAKCNLTSTSIKGKLEVINKSSSTNLWGIDLKSKFGEDVLEYQDLVIDNIKPQDRYTLNYSVETASKLLIKELIDTGYVEEEFNPSHDSLVFETEQVVAFEITLENNYDFDLKEIILVKKLPKDSYDPEALHPHDGEIMTGDEEVTWKIDTLPAGSKAMMRFKVKMKPTSKDPYETGLITVKAKGNGIFSTLNPSVKAECDNVDLKIEAKESDVPGNWKVKTSFLNNSDFDVELKSVNVKANDNVIIDKSDINLVVEANLNEPLWSEEIVVTSPEYPKIQKDVDYMVLFEVTKYCELDLTKENDLLPVVKIESQRIFEPPSVNTYTRSPLKSITTVTNVGSATIGRIFIEEVLPPYIILENVEMSLGGTTINFEKIEEEKGLQPIEGDVSLEEVSAPEKEQSFKEARVVKFKTQEIEMKPEDVLTLILTCTAEKPRPNLDYTAKSVVKAWATSPTIPHVIESVGEEGGTPELIVEYKRRSWEDSHKYVAKEDNQWSILITIKNTGEVPLENIVVRQKIMNAKYVAHEPAHVTVEEKGDVLEMLIKKLDIGKSIDLDIVVKSEGPMRQFSPEIHILD